MWCRNLLTLPCIELSILASISSTPSTPVQ
jgi:hypothetical protein